MTQSKGPLVTSFWFYNNISYHFRQIKFFHFLSKMWPFSPNSKNCSKCPKLHIFESDALNLFDLYHLQPTLIIFGHFVLFWNISNNFPPFGAFLEGSKWPKWPKCPKMFWPMAQSQGPLTTPCWFHIHISYRFGGDAPIKVREIAKMSKFGHFRGAKMAKITKMTKFFGGL